MERTRTEKILFLILAALLGWFAGDGRL